jgi:hypothetical protein
MPTLGIHDDNEAEVNAPKMWPFLKGFIDKILPHKADYVLEGIELLPSLVNTLKPNEKIKAVFLGFKTYQ